MKKIDPTALIEDGAVLGAEVEIGPYAIIGAGCRVGDGVRIGAFAVCEGRVLIGDRCYIGHHVVLGTPPQDISYRGEETGIELGDDTIVREFVTVHRATGKGQWTRIGNRCFIMAYCHIAHNCQIGSEVTMANSSSLAGYTKIEDQATLSGFVGVHQFVRIGRLSMIGGLSKVIKDIPPFTLADGHPAKLYGLNKVGLRRRKISQEDRDTIKKVYRLIREAGHPKSVDSQKLVRDIPGDMTAIICDFYAASKRGVARFTGEKKSLSDVC